MAKKSIIDEAKELLSSWKSEIEEKDGDILERKRKRDEENEKLNEELKNQFKAVSEDINEKGKKAIELFNEEFKEFSKTVKEGTASIYKKAEIEKHAEQLLEFLNKIKRLINTNLSSEEVFLLLPSNPHYKFTFSSNLAYILH